MSRRLELRAWSRRSLQMQLRALLPAPELFSKPAAPPQVRYLSSVFAQYMSSAGLDGSSKT
eukprot:13120424-Alexandrium_andersonii.AAC.1